jgi:AcrR family transcriptional regulator
MNKVDRVRFSESPGRAVKREALIGAAITVLREHGLSGCTARAIADASPLTKSALHYYFRDTEEVVDLAIRRLIGQFHQRIVDAGEAERDAVQGLWAAASTYLHLGSSQRSGQVPMLWFEVQLAATRRGNLAMVRQLTEQYLGLITAVVTRTGVSTAGEKGRALASALIGVLVRDAIEALDLDQTLRETLESIGLPVPSA